MFDAYINLIIPIINNIDKKQLNNINTVIEFTGRGTIHKYVLTNSHYCEKCIVIRYLEYVNGWDMIHPINLAPAYKRPLADYDKECERIFQECERCGLVPIFT